MRILLVSLPDPSAARPGQRSPVGLGLRCLGGPLARAGHDVSAVESGLSAIEAIELVRRAVALTPDVVLLDHSGATSGHPAILRLAAALGDALPDAWVVHASAFPTGDWYDVLLRSPQVDVVLRSATETTAVALMEALAQAWPLTRIPGLAFRDAAGAIRATPLASSLDDAMPGIGWVAARQVS